MAEVFLARKSGAEGTSKIVVVKRILPSFGASRRFRTMFIDEAQLATRLNHPNVVQVYDFSNEGAEGHILAMEYVEGPDFGMIVAAARAAGVRLPPWVSAYVIAEVAKGLHYAHEKKDDGGASLEIVHRDVSPQNVLLSYDGSVKIADFGIASARFLQDEQGVIKGKYGYMSPEQARGERVDRRSDLYSLGVILWECLSGRPLHGSATGTALLEVVRTGRVEPPSTFAMDLPAELEQIVMKLLAPRPEGRYATGRELVAAIGRALLSRQELVDGAALEATIHAFLPRPSDRRGDRGGSPAPGPELTNAAAPVAIASDRAPASSKAQQARRRAPRGAAHRARDARARPAAGAHRRRTRAPRAGDPAAPPDARRYGLQARCAVAVDLRLPGPRRRRPHRAARARPLRLRVAGLGDPRGPRRAGGRSPRARVGHDDAGPRDRLGHPRREREPRPVHVARSGHLPGRHAQPEDPAEHHVGRGRALPPRAPGVSLGRRAEPRLPERHRRPKPPADDAHLHARAQPLARGARVGARGVAARFGRAGRGEGRAGRGVPRGDERHEPRQDERARRRR